MELNLVDIANVILNEYKRSWWLWISILAIGMLMVVFSDKLGTTRREKMLSSDSGLIGVSVVVHLFALWGWL